MKTLDKQEYRLKIEKVLKLYKEKSYAEAYDIAETIDWGKVKNVSVLCAVSEIYEQAGEFQKSRDVLFVAYDRSPESKQIVYRLGTLALKQGQLKEAIDCYEEFVSLAPRDPNRFVFKYKILKAKDAPLAERINVLEDFKKVEYVEKWAFELAQLYQEAGMITECLEECDDLVLWFSEGEYIYKAMELKMKYKPLTPLQHEKYMHRFHVEEKKEEQVSPVEETKEMVEEQKPTMSIEKMLQDWEEHQKENAQMIQAEIEKAEQEKAEQEEKAEPQEEKEEILSDDVRKLMEQLEAESAEIHAQKTATEEIEVEEDKPLLQKVVEQLSALDVRFEKQEPVQETKEEATEDVIEEIEETEEEEGIKLGDTQSMAISAKALENATHVDIPEMDIPEVVPEAIPEVVSEVVPEVVAEEIPTLGETFEEDTDSYDTGFVVQGRYDLEAQSEIGLRAGLTEEQKKLFSYFVPVHGMSQQIVKVLNADKQCKTRYGTSKTGNIVIVGRKGSGKTVLAVDLVKAIQKDRRIKKGKVAIVKAEALNKKDVDEIVGKLNGGALVVEKAGRLNRNTIEVLCNVMEGQTGELLVVLEDERKPIERMFKEFPNFESKFTSRIDLPVFINDELVTFGQTYAKENGYKIDEMGILALYSDIDILQREEKVVTVADVKDLIDDAIENANRPSVKKLVQNLFGKNKDESDRVILKEEDFR